MTTTTETGASPDDLRYMARALELARRGLYSTHPNPRVGCVLVRDGRVVGEGWHRRAGEAHAEVDALAAAGGQARGATAYVTLEPCCHHGRTPPCTDALIAAGVTRVVAAMPDPNPRVNGGGLEALRAAGIQTACGVCEAEARALNRGFVSRMERGRPWLRVKLAMSLDGRIAAANGESRWITGTAAREDVHRLRAEAGAVMTGVGTVLADDPSLTVRLPGEWDPPLRIVLDTQLRMPELARMLSLPGRTLVMTAEDEGSSAWRALTRAGAELHRVPLVGHRLDLPAVLGLLAQRQVNEVLVEAGPTLAGALLQAGLADELILYLAPFLLGDRGRGLVSLPGLNSLAQRLPLQIDDIRALGQDWRIMARPAS
ncbi:MAG TPA: bifunctional diaminohydroxyphosphoribosylaminopyrimidine deaminase/5-amino-6-(5-phosphoribosylamino)uracil reductase RibD [Nevskiales bacterium]|nr:bifunctional diaminohydroxyphosphoribosylaminopyrimidine deaminase/5-amino-6-(5-phosphoribosylamino)uracil reductase RibD [Nevskiales bacterium]